MGDKGTLTTAPQRVLFIYMDIYATTQKELHSFFTDKIHIAGTKNDDNARYLKKADKNYEFSQWEMINLIDLYYNSKFETGVTDSEGQRKIFLNICKFRADVASKQIDLDVKDFVFLPDEGASMWPAYFLGRQFKQWAKEEYLGELINTTVEKFPRYGTIVLKKCGDDLEDVPLQTLRVQQDAKDLDSAKYVIIEHEDMSYEEMKEMKGWDLSGIDLKPGETTTVYERYGHVSASDYNKCCKDGASEDGEDSMDCMTIMTIKQTETKIDGNVLFMEKISERPFVESHWARQHGRWLGIGEIENQIENQIGANLSFNLFRRQLLWSAKKVFQSTDDTVGKNLVRDVKDGDILKIGPNGNITAVDMTNRAGGDFNNFSETLNRNSDQKSFTYEVATGEALPSGTPFRLGVVLSNAVNSHFDLKREKLGIFWKKAICELVIPIWADENSDEDTVSIHSTEEGYQILKETVKNDFINNSIKDDLLNGRVPNLDLIKASAEDGLKGKNALAMFIPKDFYKNAKYQVTLSVTGEEINIPKKIETLTNLYTSLSQKGDPRADRILARILAYTGESMDILAGMEEPKQALNTMPGAPSPMQMGGGMELPAKQGMQL